MGRLSTHVLDTAQGSPAKNISIELYRIRKGQAVLIKQTQTNNDGRTDEPLLQEDAFQIGEWEIVFTVGAYFAASGVALPDPPFIDRVAIRFGIAADQHYHVPLLVSPWSYSTYRGS
jgi:5-hydroxyisourate hydrolase